MAEHTSKENRSDPRTGDWRPGEDPTEIPGDPGVGGLLADPEEPVRDPKPRRMPTGSPSPDPEKPKAHGDWAPNRAWRGRGGK